MEPVDVVVVVNSDILLYDDFIDAMEHVSSQFDRFLMVGCRYDSQNSKPMPTLSEMSREWLDSFREEALGSGALHSYGGTDYYAWRPGGDPSIATVGGRIPSFTYGRGKADNWIIHMAIENKKVQVVDASTGVVAVHPAHDYSLLGAPASEQQEKQSLTGVPSGSDGARDRGVIVVKEKKQVKRLLTDNSRKDQSSPPEKYVNYWSASSGGEQWADLNKHLAYSFGNYINQQGTPMHAPWNFAKCEQPKTGDAFPCLRKRARPAPCGCEHSAYYNKTLTDPELKKNQYLCGQVSKKQTETFDVSAARA